MRKPLIVCFILFTNLFAWAGQSVSHQKWDDLLQKYVSPAGKVDYSGFAKDKLQLQNYLNALSKSTPDDSWSRNESMAYWINAYNAFTIDLILKNYPLKSIMEINGGKAWDLKFIKLSGRTYSLNDIEHEILRKKYKDARIHFAVNCASISCPRLSNKAFVAGNLEDQLNKMAISFINNKAKNSLSNAEVRISKLFDWYKDDFTQKGSLIVFLNQYSHTQIKSDAKVSFMEYNWNLNSN